MPMEFDLPLFISFSSIAVIFYSLWLVFSLKREIPGGVIGKHWNVLVWLVVLFTVGYLASPLFGSLPATSLRLIVALVFFFGAVYVVITVRMIYRIIRELAE